MPELYSLILLAVPLLLMVWLVVTRRTQRLTFERFQADLAVGREVVTTSGLLGRIVELDDTLVHLEVAPGVVLRYDRRAIGTQSLPNTATNEQE